MNKLQKIIMWVALLILAATLIVFVSFTSATSTLLAALSVLSAGLFGYFLCIKVNEDND